MKIIRLAIRTLLRFRLYTLINILGLALSLACTMIISRYVYQELTVNHFVNDLEHTYITIMQRDKDTNWRVDGVENRNNEPAFIDPLKSPSIKTSTSFFILDNESIEVDKKGFNVTAYAVDSNFLKIMKLPIVQGNSATVLTNPQSAVISRSFAEKLFGSQNPIGKTIMHSSGKEVTVDGVFDKPGSKSSFNFDLLISSSLQGVWMRSTQTIAVVYPGTDITKLNKQNTFMEMKAWGYKMRYQFYPLNKLYFDKSIAIYDNILQGNYTNIIVLSIVAILILLVGIFNFVNIYTVLMLKRAREFGLKKVFGSGSASMVGQLFAENMVMIGMALCMSWAIIEITSGLIEKQLGIPQLQNLAFDCLLSIGILFLLPAITSIFPFIRYNYATPISSLRSVNMSGNSIVSRSIFLIIQYIITFSLVVVATFFIKQLNFMLHADLGYRTNDIIKAQFHKDQSSSIRMTDAEWDARKKKEESLIAEIKHRMNESSLFTTWEYAESPAAFMHTGYKFKIPEGEYKDMGSAFLSANYFKLHNFQLKEGRLWNDSTDHWGDYTLIINETAKKLFGIKDIKTALLQPQDRLWWSSVRGDMNTNPPYRIVGVIEDFKGTHLSKATPPLAICYDNGGNYNDKLMAAIASGKRQEAISFLKKLHDDTIGGEFEYTFLEDEIKNMYKEDKKVASIYTTFALIAILISSLGLFGLSLFDVQQRYREIALRKVNGAQVKDIQWILLRKYFILLGVSFAIATPVAILAINKYLENFANRTPLSWWIFVIAAVLTAGISLFTLVFHIRKAANSNPVDMLKSE